MKKALEQFFREHRDLGIASAYLFGSQNSGQTHRESDVDVAVLLDWDRHPTRQKRFAMRVQLTSELIAALKLNDVDLVILNDVSPLFGRQVINEGTRVFRGNLEVDHAYVRDVQLRAADLEPFMRKMRRIRLEVLRA